MGLYESCIKYISKIKGGKYSEATALINTIYNSLNQVRNNNRALEKSIDKYQSLGIPLMSGNMNEKQAQSYIDDAAEKMKSAREIEKNILSLYTSIQELRNKIKSTEEQIEKRSRKN